MSISTLNKISKFVRGRNKKRRKIIPISRVDRWEVQTLRTIKSLRAIRPTWEKLQEQSEHPLNPETDLDRYISLIETTRERDEPYVLILSQNNTPKAMLIAKKGPGFIKCSIGYKDIMKPSLCCITVIYGGCISLDSAKACTEILKQLHNALRQSEADVVIFKQQRINSQIYRMAKTLTSDFCRSHFHKVNLHWKMLVPDNINVFYGKLLPKTRNTLKRYMGRLDKNYKATVFSCTNQNELHRALSEAASVSSKTYQNALDSGLINDSATAAQLKTAAKQGWLCLHILYLGDKPSAFQLGFKYRKTYFLQQMGFDPDLSKWRVGTYLFLKVLDELCKDPLLNCFDFGFGDAEYKRRYGDESWEEATFYMFAPKLYPMTVNAITSLINGMSKGMLILSKKTGFERRLKRKWRNWLQHKNQPSKK